MRALIKATAAIVLSLASMAAFAAPDFAAMLKAVDDLGSFPGKDVSVTYSVVDQKPGKPDSFFQWSFFRRDDKDQMVMVTLKPDTQAGEGILKISDDVYRYQPDVGWTHFSMSKDIQNSKAKASDFRGSRLSEDYDVVASEEVALGKFPAWALTLKAKTVEVSYDWVKVYIRKDKPIILKQEDYSQAETFDKATLLRTVTYPPKYVEVAGKMMPVEIRMVDEVIIGNKTTMSISENPKPKDPKKPEYLIAAGYTDAKGKYSDHLPESTFSKAFLEKTNKK